MFKTTLPSGRLYFHSQSDVFLSCGSSRVYITIGDSLFFRSQLYAGLGTHDKEKLHRAYFAGMDKTGVSVRTVSSIGKTVCLKFPKHLLDDSTIELHEDSAHLNRDIFSGEHWLELNVNDAILDKEAIKKLKQSTEVK